jgi:hypothetical protein
MALAGPARAEDCRDAPRLHALDFWLGHWAVSSDGETAGNNTIESILGGCAITERWTDVRGRAGFSLFYYDRNADSWKQVWVTESSLVAGDTKEKKEIRNMTTASAIRFQGRYHGDAPGVMIEDRTTLTREAADRVRQIIEISTDGGKTWHTTFEGYYLRAEP